MRLQLDPATIERQHPLILRVERISCRCVDKMRRDFGVNRELSSCCNIRGSYMP